MSTLIVAGTGHRPNKLGGYSVKVESRLIYLAESYLSENKPDFVISGMALGWDLALAEASIRQSIPFIAAVPFKGQESVWPKKSRDLYNEILNQAKDVVYVSDPGYSSYKMQIRNKWMVDKCNILLALWDGSEGGTGNCVRYANEVGREVHNLWSEFNKLK